MRLKDVGCGEGLGIDVRYGSAALLLLMLKTVTTDLVSLSA
jgi:hypothetical protein